MNAVLEIADSLTSQLCTVTSSVNGGINSAANDNFARISNGVVTWLHKDHLGSATVATSANGLVSWREQYKPFGETMNNLSINNDLDGFTGHIKDSATGLTYMQARYYDPSIGRFLSIDPINFTPDQTFMFGRYTYVNNDPVNAVDPDGEFINFLIGAAIGVAVEAYSIHKEGGDIFDVKGNAGRYGKSAAIGAVSGGLGGAVAKQGATIAGKTILSQVAKSGGGAVGKVGTGALAGSTAGATAESITQLVETGGINDIGAVVKAGVTGAVVGGAAGGAQAAVQKGVGALSGTIPPTAANLSGQGNPLGLAGPFPGATAPGSAAGAAAGTLTNLGGEIAKEKLEEH